MTDTSNLPGTDQVREMVFEPTRGLRYVEVFAVGPDVITVYNSIGLSEGPPEVWDALGEEAAARELGVGKALKNGPHWWQSDRMALRFGVEEVSVGGIGFRFAARLPAFIAASGKLEPPVYSVAQANKVGRLDYAAGAPVYELISPDGETFVMQSSNMPAEKLAELGDRLQPPEGWQYRPRTLDGPLAIPLDGKVRTVMDELRNVYNMSSS